MFDLWLKIRSRDFADAEFAKNNRRALALQAKIPFRRFDVGAAGNFLAVDPEPNLAVDRADVIVVPVAVPLGQVFAREAAAAQQRPWATTFAVEYI